MPVKKGLLIVFEGIDGSGKSTQASLLKRKLEKRGYDVACFSEPSESRWGLKIKKEALFPDSLTPEEELSLFVRDRKENVKKNVLPALKRGKIVILDRYYFSTISYQGAKGIDTRRIRDMNESFAPRPDLVFILDVEPETGLKRIRDRKQKMRLFEQEEYLVRVREIFRQIKGSNVIHVDASKKEEEVAEQIEKIVFGFLKNTPLC
ncbi:MAG: dTMP kinase [Candidatus Aminicenantales bacterium]